MQVDPRTLRPRDYGPSIKNKLDEAKLESDIANGLESVRKLKSKDGKAFVTLIEQSLVKRVDELVSKDPESLTLLGLLGKFGYDIKIGEAAAKRLTQIHLSRQVEE